MEDTRVHALDYLHIVQRRKWWLITPIVASIAVGLMLVQTLPREYRATATVAVSAPSVSPTLVSESTQFDDQERLRAISQQLLSTPILAKVIDLEHLGRPDDERRIARLRESFSISIPDPVATLNEPRRLDSFLLSYRDSVPERAQRVVNRIVAVFGDEISKSRAAHAEETSAFIAGQVRSSQQRLNDLEASLRKAKESHIGQLPEQTQANLSTLSGLRQQLESNATALRGEQDRLSMIERGLQELRNGGTAVPLGLSPSGAPVVPTPESHVVELERDLAAARAAYTDKHPEVLRLQEELAAARKDAESARARIEAGGPDVLRMDPTHRQLTTDQEMARLRIRDLQRADVELRRQISFYQARVESAPMVEQQLAGMQRDYDLERQQYSELSSKLHTATLAENVQRNGNGEQFTLLYPASLPTAPAWPVPWRVMLVAVAVGIALGGTATIGREYLDRSIHDVRDLREELDCPVLGEIAHIRAA